MGGVVADYLISKGLSVRNTRKLVTAVGFCPTAICLCIVGYVPCNNQGTSIALITIIVGVMNFSYSGYGVNQLDLSPQFAGIIWSITAFVSNVSGSLTPLVTGYITNKHPTRYYYGIVFLAAAGVCMFGAAAYCLCASGEEQEWSRINCEDEHDDGYPENEGEEQEKERLLNS